MKDEHVERITKALESIADSLVKLANPIIHVTAPLPQQGKGGPGAKVDIEYGTPHFKRKTIELPRNQP